MAPLPGSLLGRKLSAPALTLVGLPSLLDHGPVLLFHSMAGRQLLRVLVCFVFF